MIKGAEKIFFKKAEALEIKIIKKLRVGNSFIYSGLLDKKKVIFKLRRVWRSYSIEGLKREILMERILNNNELADKPFQYRNIILYDIKYPQWVVYEYKEGEKALGKKCRHRFWCFSEDFYKIVSSQKMCEVLNFWQDKITDFVFTSSQLFPYRFKKYGFSEIYKDFSKDSDFYFKYYLKNNIGMKKVFNEKDRKNGKKIFKKFQAVIESNNSYICHGDLHPGNFLIYKDEIVIIDFDKVHIDIPYVDLVFVWFASWNNPKWRNDLLLLLDKNNNSRVANILFNLNFVRFMPHFIINIEVILDGEKNTNQALSILKNDYQKAIKFLEKEKAI